MMTSVALTHRSALNSLPNIFWTIWSNEIERCGSGRVEERNDLSFPWTDFYSCLPKPVKSHDDLKGSFVKVRVLLLFVFLCSCPEMCLVWHIKSFIVICRSHYVVQFRDIVTFRNVFKWNYLDKECFRWLTFGELFQNSKQVGLTYGHVQVWCDSMKRV